MMECILENNDKKATCYCGSSKIYDGNFTKTIIDVDGATVSLLRQNGTGVFSDKEIPIVVERLKILDY